MHSDEMMSAYEAELVASRAKAHEALRAVHDEAAEAAAARNAALETKLAAELEEAEARIAAERQAALANIASIATDLAAAAMEKLIGGAADADTVARAVGNAEASRS